MYTRMTEEPNKRKCSGCRCLRNDYTRHPTRCDRCTDRKRPKGRFQDLKANPEAYAKFLARKREARKRKAEEKQRARLARDARFRPVVVEDDGGWDEEVAPKRDVTPLVRMYEGGASTTAVAKAFGLAPGYAYKLLASAGVVFRDRASATSMAMVEWHARPKARDVFDADTACDQYKAGASLAGIAKELGREVKTIKKFLVHAGIPIRSAEEQWRLQFGGEGGGTPRPINGITPPR